MIRTVRHLVNITRVAALCLLAPAELAGQAPAPSLPFNAGETLTYDVSWSGAVSAGTLVLSVKDARSATFEIVAEARPRPILARVYPLYYRAETRLDTRTLLSERGSVYSEEGRRKRLKVTSFDRRTNQAEYEMQTATLVKASLEVPPAAQDALAALYVLRASALKVGDRLTLPVCDSGKIYTVVAHVEARETAKTALGTIGVLRTAVTMVGAASGERRLTLWLSDDARRVPVKLQVDLAVGSFVIALAEG